jgi:hypothetical protein
MTNEFSCEGIILTYKPFTIGGEVWGKEVCARPATWKCTGMTEKEKAGPAMYMCNNCRVEFLKKNPEYAEYCTKVG